MRRLLTKSAAIVTVAGAAAMGVAACSAANATDAPARAAGSATPAPFAAGPGSFAFGGQPYVVTGLTSDQRLVVFRSNDPGRVRDSGRIKGLRDDKRLIGIDFRSANGLVYGVGDKGGIYTIRLRDAATRKVSQLTTPLEGKAFDIDFNPAANRLRVISDTGQNLRHNIDDPQGAPAAGQTAVDQRLTNPPPPGQTTPVPASGVTGAAYTNNDKDAATATTLFDLDTTADQVSIQSPANNGTLAPTGKLGVAADGDAGFDIRSRGSQATGIAALSVGGAYRQYSVDLLTGKVTKVGSFPKRFQVTDLTAYF